MGGRDRRVDAGYDGESKQEKCQCAPSRWMEPGGPETAPVSTLKCAVPLTSPKACFHPATKVVMLILTERGGGCCCAGIGASHLSPLIEAAAAGVWITTTWRWFPLMMLLRVSLFSSRCSLHHHLLFSHVQFIVSLITMTIWKCACAIALQRY